MSNNIDSDWLLLLALFNMLRTNPGSMSSCIRESKTSAIRDINKDSVINPSGMCCTVRPIDPLKMTDAISKPCTCNPFEGYSIEEIEMLLNHRGKEI
jgi:hypothetical protein